MSDAEAVFPLDLKKPILCCKVNFRSLKEMKDFLTLFSGTLHSVGDIFPFLPCFSLLFFPSVICKASSDNHFAVCTSFSLGWF